MAVSKVPPTLWGPTWIKTYLLYMHQATVETGSTLSMLFDEHDVDHVQTDNQFTIVTVDINQMMTVIEEEIKKINLNATQTNKELIDDKYRIWTSTRKSQLVSLQRFSISEDPFTYVKDLAPPSFKDCTSLSFRYFGNGIWQRAVEFGERHLQNLYDYLYSVDFCSSVFDEQRERFGYQYRRLQKGVRIFNLMDMIIDAHNSEIHVPWTSCLPCHSEAKGKESPKMHGEQPEADVQSDSLVHNHALGDQGACHSPNLKGGELQGHDSISNAGWTWARLIAECSWNDQPDDESWDIPEDHHQYPEWSGRW